MPKKTSMWMFIATLLLIAPNLKIQMSIDRKINKLRHICIVGNNSKIKMINKASFLNLKDITLSQISKKKRSIYSDSSWTEIYIRQNYIKLLGRHQVPDGWGCGVWKLSTKWREGLVLWQWKCLMVSLGQWLNGCIFTKTHWTVHLKYVYFLVCKL